MPTARPGRAARFRSELTAIPPIRKHRLYNGIRQRTVRQPNSATVREHHLHQRKCGGAYYNATSNRYGNTTYTNGNVGGAYYNATTNRYGNNSYTNGTLGNGSFNRSSYSIGNTRYSNTYYRW